MNLLERMGFAILAVIVIIVGFYVAAVMNHLIIGVLIAFFGMAMIMYLKDGGKSEGSYQRKQ